MSLVDNKTELSTASSKQTFYDNEVILLVIRILNCHHLIRYLVESYYEIKYIFEFIHLFSKQRSDKLT